MDYCMLFYWSNYLIKISSLIICPLFLELLAELLLVVNVPGVTGSGES
jgi:hypothetical protein